MSSPSPGPTLDIADPAPDRAVSTSSPNRQSAVADIAKVSKYRKTNDITAYIMLSLMGRPLNRGMNTPLG